MISLIPLLIMTLVNYYHDQSAFRAESSYSISRILSNTKRTLESVIEERRNVLSLIVNEQSYDELKREDGLATTLRNLKNSFGGFIDLGLIENNGNQLVYVGPYDLQGKNYKDQEWFHEVSLRGVYVSDVFMGYRNFPHFVIAIKHEKEDGGYCVLRATIDVELLSREILTLNLNQNTDAFLINRDGVLQTQSVFYGDFLHKSNVKVPPRASDREVVNFQRENGKWVTSGYVYIKDSPFILIALHRHQNLLKYWMSKRVSLLWFLTVCIIVIIILVYARSTYLMKKLRDADQRKARALHSAEYSNKMATIGRMAASVAHEINNPLAIINEKAGLLKDIAGFTPDYPKKDKTLLLLDSILNSVERCKTVTHRLLGFARRMDMQTELVDIGHLLKEVVGFMGKESAHRSIEINYNIPESAVPIESDRGQLQQIFLNIINNAFAAVKDGGKIDLTVRQNKGNSISVEVEDNGSGISKENLNNIFEPFYSTKGEFGTGLGLSITRDLISKLGGKIEVRSEVGVGTRFTVTLPLKRTDKLE
jgi:signal transduction histidine kinase